MGIQNKMSGNKYNTLSDALRHHENIMIKYRYRKSMLLLFYFLTILYTFNKSFSLLCKGLIHLNVKKYIMVRTLHFVGVSDLLLSDLPAGRAPRMATQCNVLLLPVDMVLSAASINS